MPTAPEEGTIVIFCALSIVATIVPFTLSKLDIYIVYPLLVDAFDTLLTHACAPVSDGLQLERLQL